MTMPFPILSPDHEYTSSLVSQIKTQIDTLLTLLAQQEEDLREARVMLHRANMEVMLYGKIPPPDDTASLGCDFESAFFLVAAMELPVRAQLFHTDGSARFSQREVELMKTAIYNVFETALGPYCIATCCESDLAFANILINLLDEDQPEDLILSAIDNALQSAITLVARNYGINLVAARSPIVEGYESLPHARIAAYQALQQKFSIDQIANTGVIPPLTAAGISSVPQPNAKLEKQYYQYILSRDLEMAQVTLHELTSRDLKTEGIPFELAKLRFMNHVESLLNIFGIASTDISYLYLRPLDTEHAIYQLLDDLFQDMDGRITSNEQAQKEKIDSIAKYIEENYADCNLCLAKLCDIFQMNQSYLSRTFKSLRGIGVLDFIHSQRLIHVKTLLKNPDNSIDAIWEAVGYTNRRTFNRTFRKLVGMSASEYRKNILQQ